MNTAALRSAVGHTRFFAGHHAQYSRCSPSLRSATVVRAEKPQESSSTPTEQEPVWVRREREKALQAAAGPSVPWALSLLGSGIIAIAAVGSIFEFAYRHALFGVIQPDNILWAPILLFFAVTGLPLAGFLFLQGVNGFNEDAERQDKLDGYVNDDK